MFDICLLSHYLKTSDCQQGIGVILELHVATMLSKCQLKQQRDMYLQIQKHWIVVKISPGNRHYIISADLLDTLMIHATGHRLLALLARATEIAAIAP